MNDLKYILDKNDIEYELIYHNNTIHSAQEGADYFGIDIGQTAPTLILKTDKGFFALIISGNRGRINFEDVARVLGCKQIKLAGAREVQKVTGFTVGSVALVGLNLPCVIDKQLYRYSFIYGGTGRSNSTLKISPSAVKQLNQVVAEIELTFLI